MSQFKVGNVVRCVDAAGHHDLLRVGEQCTVYASIIWMGDPWVAVEPHGCLWRADRFTLVTKRKAKS